MMITKQLANQIVEQTMLRLHRNINVMQTNGVILASGDHLRINSIHEGAIEVTRTLLPLHITKSNNHLFPHSKPGINMPIFFQKELVGVIGITGDPEELVEFANLVQLTTEMMVHQTLIVSEREWKRKLQEMIFEELLSGQTSKKLLVERLKKLGFKNVPPYYAMMLEINPETSSYQSILQEIEILFPKGTVLVGHYQAKEHFILVSSLTKLEFSHTLKNFLSSMQKFHILPIGVGQEVESLDQVLHAYKTAKVAYEYGNDKNDVKHFEEAELFYLLKNKETPEVKHFTSRLLATLDNKLIHTLQVYFHANQQLLISADELNIHRHTLTYRLQKVKELTGYDPSVFQEALLLQIALWLQK